MRRSVFLKRMANAATTTPLLSHKLAVLVFVENRAGEHLLIRRAKMPNLGNWSPIGGKVETAQGESPFECAVRETGEEAAFQIRTEDLHLFGMISEKAYEGQSHWLLFLFRCTKPIDHLPADIDEGQFGFFARDAIKDLSLPETDRTALWPIYDKYRDRFVALKADCMPGKTLQIEIEEVTPA
jgi:8-oxo-dGTP diphosphatase